MVQPVWSGFLRISLVSCQVHLAPATNEGMRGKLRRLNSATGRPLALEYVDPRSGVAVPAPSTATGGTQ